MSNEILLILNIFFITIYFFSACFLVLMGYNCYYYLWLFLKNKDKHALRNNQFIADFYQQFDTRSFPIITTQLPIFNEKYVVHRLIDAVCQIDYPKDKHEIQILDDSDDETADIIREIVESYKKKGFDIVQIRRSNRIDFKAGALSEGTNLSKGEYLAIFDSDFVPPRDFLKKTLPFMISNKKIGLVQTRWGHLNSNQSLLTMCQSVGIDGHFIIEQSARCWGDLFLNFNGTAGVWRKKTIQNAGGWQGDTLTEDMDLSYRAQLKGWNTQFLYDVICKAELPQDMNSFKSQQYRWAKGSIQTAVKLLPTIFKSQFSFKKKLQSALHLTHYGIHPCMVIMSLTALPILCLSPKSILSIVFNIFILIILFGSLLAPSSMYIISQRSTYRNWKRRIAIIPVLVSVGVGLAINNTIAVLSALFGHKGQFIRTPKTGHSSYHPQQKNLVIPKNKKTYKVKFKKIFLLELSLSFYCFFSFFIYIQAEKFFIGPFLLIYALGFLTASVLSIKHQFKSARY